MFALGILRLRPEFGPQLLAEALVSGLLAGFGVAFIEETFFRGLMYRAVSRESGFAVAAGCTALVYAAIHFLAPAEMPADEVAWDSGLRLLGGALTNYSDPLPVVDSFVTLVLVGLFLALVRRRTGAIAAGIGLHMGWVWVIKSTRVVTHVNEDAAWNFLVSSFDHYTGWLVAAWAALLVAVAWARGWFTAGPAPAR
jgi:membrane protease YdiL (CAAX protease family)